MCIRDRDLSFAIVDEVDSILIDEARTPLIISGRGEESTKLYQMADQFAKDLDCYVIAETDDKEFDEEVEQNYDYICLLYTSVVVNTVFRTVPKSAQNLLRG